MDGLRGVLPQEPERRHVVPSGAHTGDGVFSEGVLTLATTSAIQYEQLSAPSRLSELERLASDYSGKAVSVQVSAPERLHKTEAELKKEFASHPVIKSLTETFGASLIRCIPVEHTRS